MSSSKSSVSVPSVTAELVAAPVALADRSAESFAIGSGVDVDFLKRVAVVAGAPSALHGSNAIGDVAAFATKHPSDLPRAPTRVAAPGIGQRSMTRGSRDVIGRDIHDVPRMSSLLPLAHDTATSASTRQRLTIDVVDNLMRPVAQAAQR
jgi:hypothetical protein